MSAVMGAVRPVFPGGRENLRTPQMGGREMKKKGKDQKAFPGAASAAASALLLTVMAALVFCSIRNKEEGQVLRFGMCAESYWGRSGRKLLSDRG